MIYHLDYETRSAIDLTEVGAFKYAQHHSTRILIASLAKGDGKPATWSVLDPDNADFALLADELAHDPDPVVYAHNSQFEAALTEFCHDGPGLRVPASAWRCTAAMARRAGLRSKLEHLSEDLGLVMAKDPKGKALIRFFSLPNEDGSFNEPKDHPEKFAAFVSYCERDVEAEQEVGAKLAFFDLKGEALKVFQFDSRLNRRGIPVNVPALWHAKAIIDEVDARLGKQFYELTGLRQAQRAKVFAWLQARGYTGADMTSDTVAEQLLRTDWDPAPYTGDAPDGGMGRDALAREYARAREALRLYSQLAFAAAKKVEAMLASVCEDGTVKGSFLYYGAGTGRWAGRGIQPQNFKKPTIPVADLPAAFDLIASGSATAEVLELMFGVPALETVASCVRNFIGPEGGLLDADYAAIEARIVDWGAGQDDVLDLFRKGADLYIRMAARIYGIPEAQVPKKGNMRQLGKAAILGCFATGSKVLTDTGVKEIQNVTAGDRVWDGVDFVHCDGAVYQGCKHTIDLLGLRVTPDHLILCGNTWIPAGEVAQNAAYISRALATGLDGFKSPGSALAPEEESPTLSRSVTVAPPSTWCAPRTCEMAAPGNAIAAPRKLLDIGQKSFGGTRIFAPTTHTELGCSIASLPLRQDAKTPMTGGMILMVGAGYDCTLSGSNGGGIFCATYSPSPDGTTPPSNSTALTTGRGISRGTSGLSPEKSTSETGEPWQSYRSESNISNANSNTLDCWDLLNCGPRSRFVVLANTGPIIAHNCGYGMGAKKFYETCLSWGIEVSADLAEQAVKAYRSTHPKVTAFWRDLDRAAKDAVQNPGKWFLVAGGKARFIVREAAGMPYLFMVLPSGRAVAYPKPEVKRVFKEAFNDHIEELSYWGQVKSFMGRIGIYGGKWAENWTQAVAADVMATGATNAEAAGFDVFALIHDQALAANDPRGVKPFVAALTKMPDWADGMPLAAEGNWATYYTKD